MLCGKGGDLGGGGGGDVDKRAVLEQLPTEALRRIASKQRGKRKVLRVEYELKIEYASFVASDQKVS